MKPKISLVLIGLCVLIINIPCFGQGPDRNPSDTLTVLTFNLYGAPESEWPARLGMILYELEMLHPDLIGFQEVVQTPGQGGSDNRAKVIVESLFYRTGYGYQ